MRIRWQSPIEGGSGFLTHTSYQVRPKEDLAKALEPGVDYILQGYVDTFLYEGEVISYGLSVYGPGLWFCGLPAGHTKNSLSVRVELQRAADKTVVCKVNQLRRSEH